MARRVYFAFHYQRDIFRVNVVRNAHVVEGVAAAGFSDGSLWEKAKGEGDAAIKRLIDRGLEGTSVTAVLIGAETAYREYVKYEIDQSWARGNGLLGIYLENITDIFHGKGVHGQDPFIVHGYSGIRTYDWVNDNGYEKFGRWADLAANQPRKVATPAPVPTPAPSVSALARLLATPAAPAPSYFTSLLANAAPAPIPESPYSALARMLYGNPPPTPPSTRSSFLEALQTNRASETTSDSPGLSALARALGHLPPPK